jgi:acetolactate synthase regulatory subunit
MPQIFKLQNYQITQLQILFEGSYMQVFHIRYRNAQGALMRILNAASRRGLDLTSVHAEYAGQDHAVTLLLEASHKQTGQLFREWYAIVDVIDVRSGAALREHQDAVWAPHPPANVTGQSAQAARA